MDGATLQDRIYRGRGRVATYIGLPCNVYRPTDAAVPLGNPIAQINVALNAADANYLKANLYGKPVWYADCDGRQTRPGDYLVRVTDNRVWFIAAQQQLLPIVAIDCNATVRVQRQPASTTFGASPYSGLVAPVDVLGTEATPWPASILLGGRALPAVGLPADVKESGWRILLPPSVPITIKAGDLMTDDKARRFAVESAERSDLGWRLTVNEAHA